MDWWTVKQKRIGLQVETVAGLIKALQQCPQVWKVRNVDKWRFCEIRVATDGTDKLVELYQLERIMTAEQYEQIVFGCGFKRGPHATCGKDYYYLPKESYPDELFEYKGTRYILLAGGSGTGYLCLDPYLGSNNRIIDRAHGPIGSDISMKYFKDITESQVRKALDEISKCQEIKIVVLFWTPFLAIGTVCYIVYSIKEWRRQRKDAANLPYFSIL